MYLKDDRESSLYPTAAPQAMVMFCILYCTVYTHLIDLFVSVRGQGNEVSVEDYFRGLEAGKPNI